MALDTALILFAHGARDPRWAAPFQRLQAMTQVSLPQVMVALAYLEFMNPSLPELVAQAVAAGVRRVSIVPVFLGQGGHVLRDLPVLLEQLRNAYPDVLLTVRDAAGEDELVLSAIRDYCLKAL